MSVRLPTVVSSPDQLTVCIQELRALANKKRDAALETQATHKIAATPDISPSLQKFFRDNGVTRDDPRTFDALIAILEDIRTQAPRVHVTLAALPGAHLTETLTAWFRQYVHEYTLLTIVMNREIGGGVVVRAGSNIYDFSFTSQIFKHKDKIAEIFARVR